MAKCEPVEAPTWRLELSDAEARALKKILGDCAGGGPAYNHTHNIYDVLDYAGVGNWKETNLVYNEQEADARAF